MDTKAALFEVDSMIGEFSIEMSKLVFCRQMVAEVAANGRAFEASSNAGLGYILEDVEAGFEKLREGIKGLFDQANADQGAEAQN